MTAREFNFDGLVGPTHNYAGLSPGNLASTQSVGRRSHPRRAALQGLDKMAMLHSLGVPQAILPPQPRPDLAWLRRQDYEGDDASVIRSAARDAPRLLAAAYSASSMWTANAATIIPSADAHDGRLHLHPANLTSELHRSIEPRYTARVLSAIFPDEQLFAHHAPVANAGDEGAANHIRLCQAYGQAGIEIFVYGQPDPSKPFGTETNESRDRPRTPLKHPARQTEVASRTIASSSGIAETRRFFVQQNPLAIDAGVFHNDVIATGDRDLLLVHEDAFVDQARVLSTLRSAFAEHCGGDLQILEISRTQLSLARAVETYFFNCQIVESAEGRRVFIGPIECREDSQSVKLLESLANGTGPFDEIRFIDLRESMRNGGGPACLRLRVVMTEAQRSACHPGIFYDAALHGRLVDVIERTYREDLDPSDLEDPDLVPEADAALSEILGVLGLESVYADLT